MRVLNHAGPGALSIALALTLGGAALAQDKDPSDLRVYWKNGLRLENADKSLTLKFGGRIMSDWAQFNEEDAPAGISPFDDGTEFRRARLFFEGVIQETVEFKAQYDFAGGDADFKDVYIGLLGIPGVDSLRFGHQKEPFSLEEQTSSKYMTFMERALPNAFSPERNTGVRAAGTGLQERLTWSAGAFTETDGFGDSEDMDGGANLTGRITGLPLWQDGGARALHLGLSATRKAATGDTLRFSQRPEAHLASTYIDTGAMAADSALILDAEVAWVHDIVSVQGEYMTADVDAPAAGDPSFSGGYVQASVFLTGEHRAYKQSDGAFDRVRPGKNFGKGGAGAWELAARYSTLDLTDAAIAGGELKDLTLGVNWYLNPNARFMLNYVKADLSNRAGIPDNDEFSAVMLRFQVDF